jgi:hypothetical protein
MIMAVGGYTERENIYRAEKIITLAQLHTTVVIIGFNGGRRQRIKTFI